MKTNILTLFLLIIISLFSACEKNELAPNLEETLTVAPWTAKKTMLNGSLLFEYNLDAYTEVTVFHPDKTYKRGNANSFAIYDYNFSSNESGTWDFEQSDSSLYIETIYEDGSSNEYNYKIDKLTNKELIIGRRYFDSSLNRIINQQTVYVH